MRPTQQSRSLRVWVTRAEPGASATAARLVAAGHTPLVAPLLHVIPLTAPEPPAAATLVFTSANAVRAYAALCGRRNAEVYAVGDATAQAARSAGFADVCSAAGDVLALARRIAHAAPAGPILHPCAMEAAGDLAGALGGVGVEVLALPLYRTDPVASLPAPVAAALEAGGLDAVLLHSPKAARTLAALLADRPFAELARVRPVGLSVACIAPLADLPLQAPAVATTPDEAALLGLLG